jgi:hypothetical protein
MVAAIATVLIAWAAQQGCRRAGAITSTHSGLSADEDDISWGPSTNDVRVGLSIDKTSYLPGETIVCRVYLRNTSGTPVHLQEMGTSTVLALITMNRSVLRATKVKRRNSWWTKGRVLLGGKETRKVMSLSILSSVTAEAAFADETDGSVLASVGPRPTLWVGMFTLRTCLTIVMAGRGRVAADSGAVMFRVGPAVEESAAEHSLVPPLADGTSMPPSAHAPSQTTFTVHGQVRLPGTYPWTNGITLLKAIATAGGYTDTKIVRVLTGTVDLVKPANKEDRTLFRFRSGDNFVWVDVRRLETKPELHPTIRPGCVIVVGAPSHDRTQ